MMSQYYFQKIRELKAAGQNKTQASKELKLNWKTISKYWDSNTPPSFHSKKHRKRKDPTENFSGRIDSLLENFPKIKAIDLFEQIKREGYIGSLRTVERRLEKINGQRPKERFFQQEYEPGEQVQFDFKEKVEFLFKEGPRFVYLHFGTLPFSGKTVVKAYGFQNFECFIDGVHHFFEVIGGLTKNIRIDNLSPCVKTVLKGRQREWTQSFERAINYYGFGVLPCTPAKGNEKGHVERDIQTYTRRIQVRSKLDSMVFQSWDELNQWLLKLMNEEQKTLEEKFIIESKELLLLPPRKKEVLFRIESVIANQYGTVRLGKSVYSVPDSAIGMPCVLTAEAYEIKIFRSNDMFQPIAIHPRKPDGEKSVLLEHILPSLIRKPQAMIRWIHRDLLFPHPILKTYYQHLKKKEKDGAEREFLRGMNLLHYVNLQELCVAIELILNEENFNPLKQPFDHLKELLLIQKKPASDFSFSQSCQQQKINPELLIYDSFIPSQGGDLL